MLEKTKKQIKELQNNVSKYKPGLTIYAYGSKIELKFQTSKLPCKLKESLEELGFKNKTVRTTVIQIYYLNFPGSEQSELKSIIKALINDLGDQFNVNLLQ